MLHIIENYVSESVVYRFQKVDKSKEQDRVCTPGWGKTFQPMSGIFVFMFKQHEAWLYLYERERVYD